MSFRIKIILLLFGLTTHSTTSGQILKGVAFNQEDSLTISFLVVQLLNSSGNSISTTTTNHNGEFFVHISENAYSLIITPTLPYAEIKIVNLDQNFSDTLDLGLLPIQKGPNFLQVQFKEISIRKEKRKQRQLIRTYNKKIKNTKDLVIELNGQKVKLKANSEKQMDSDRLKLVYSVDFNDLKKKN